MLTQYNRISFVLEACKFVKTFISFSYYNVAIYVVINYIYIERRQLLGWNHAIFWRKTTYHY